MRKPHHKTKLGCVPCKKRRVKCDLGRPDCGGCSRRGVICSFRSIDPAPRRLVARHASAVASTGSSLSATPNLSQALPSPTPLDVLSLDGLLETFPEVLHPRFKHLLQHFAFETSSTISHDEKAQTAWCAAIPQLSATHQFVLQGICAISALHLSRSLHDGKERKHLDDIAAAQMNTGLIQYRKSMEKVDADNAEALFSFSVTATAFIILTTNDECNIHIQSIATEGQGNDRRPIATAALVRAMTKIMHTLRGVLVIIVPCWNIIANGILSAAVKRDWWPYPIPTSPQGVEEDRRLRRIESLWMRPGRRYEYWFDTLIQSQKKLREIFALVSQLTISDKIDGNGNKERLIDWTSVFAWPVGSPHSLINLLEQRQPEAWVLLAHYAILLFRCGKLWWMGDIAPNIVYTAALVLEDDMLDWIEWPASVVGADLKSLRPTSTISMETKT